MSLGTTPYPVSPLASLLAALNGGVQSYNQAQQLAQQRQSQALQMQSTQQNIDIANQQAFRQKQSDAANQLDFAMKNGMFYSAPQTDQAQMLRDAGMNVPITGQSATAPGIGTTNQPLTGQMPLSAISNAQVTSQYALPQKPFEMKTVGELGPDVAQSMGFGGMAPETPVATAKEIVAANRTNTQSNLSAQYTQAQIDEITKAPTVGALSPEVRTSMGLSGLPDTVPMKDALPFANAYSQKHQQDVTKAGAALDTIVGLAKGLTPDAAAKVMNSPYVQGLMKMVYPDAQPTQSAAQPTAQSQPTATTPPADVFQAAVTTQAGPSSMSDVVSATTDPNNLPLGSRTVLQAAGGNQEALKASGIDQSLWNQTVDTARKDPYVLATFYPEEYKQTVLKPAVDGALKDAKTQLLGYLGKPNSEFDQHEAYRALQQFQATRQQAQGNGFSDLLSKYSLDDRGLMKAINSKAAAAAHAQGLTDAAAQRENQRLALAQDASARQAAAATNKPGAVPKGNMKFTKTQFQGWTVQQMINEVAQNYKSPLNFLSSLNAHGAELTSLLGKSAFTNLQDYAGGAGWKQGSKWKPNANKPDPLEVAIPHLQNYVSQGYWPANPAQR